MEFVNTTTSLIEHHLERKDVRKEWYELAEKGMKILQILENLIKLVEDEEPTNVEKGKKEGKTSRLRQCRGKGSNSRRHIRSRLRTP